MTIAMAPFGRALLAYQRGEIEATFSILREDGFAVSVPIAVFFRPPSEFSSIERTALDSCRGHVLDVGAGGGIHSLALQARGLRVTAVDANGDAVTVLRERGVREVHQAAVMDYAGGPFDTLLLLGHGIGMTETLVGLDRFLEHARTLLRPDGQVLVHSVDVRETTDERHLAYHEANRRAGRYVGEITLRFEHKGDTGPLLTWLHVDPGTLREHADAGGWDCEVIVTEAEGEYLARLMMGRSNSTRGNIR